jgi:hypothetical protein
MRYDKNGVLIPHWWRRFGMILSLPLMPLMILIWGSSIAWSFITQFKALYLYEGEDI